MGLKAAPKYRYMLIHAHNTCTILTRSHDIGLRTSVLSKVSSKLLNKSEITPIFRQLVLLPALPVAGLETDFAIDSTGFRTTTFSIYEGEKYGRNKNPFWLLDLVSHELEEKQR